MTRQTPLLPLYIQKHSNPAWRSSASGILNFLGALIVGTAVAQDNHKNHSARCSHLVHSGGSAGRRCALEPHYLVVRHPCKLFALLDWQSVRRRCHRRWCKVSTRTNYIRFWRPSDLTPFGLCRRHGIDLARFATVERQGRSRQQFTVAPEADARGCAYSQVPRSVSVTAQMTGKKPWASSPWCSPLTSLSMATPSVMCRSGSKRRRRRPSPWAQL